MRFGPGRDHRMTGALPLVRRIVRAVRVPVVATRGIMDGAAWRRYSRNRDVILSGTRTDAEVGQIFAGQKPVPSGETTIVESGRPRDRDVTAGRLVYEASRRSRVS